MSYQPTYVIPCSGAKLDRPARARELYQGSMFTYTLAKAERAAELIGARVLVLSALYGLVELDDVLEPYERKLGRGRTDIGLAIQVREQLRDLDVSVAIALLPIAYRNVLDYAARSSTAVDGGRRVMMFDAFDGCRGIGDQRARLAQLVRNLELDAARVDRMAIA